MPAIARLSEETRQTDSLSRSGKASRGSATLCRPDRKAASPGLLTPAEPGLGFHLEKPLVTSFPLLYPFQCSADIIGLHMVDFELPRVCVVTGQYYCDFMCSERNVFHENRRCAPLHSIQKHPGLGRARRYVYRSVPWRRRQDRRRRLRNRYRITSADIKVCI